MIQRLKAPVSVMLSYDHQKRITAPQAVVFDGREYPISKVGMHHTFREGRTLWHVYSVASSTLFFRLVLNTDNLTWVLEEIADGEAD